MPKLTFGKALLAVLLFAVVVLLLVRQHPDLDSFGPEYTKERFADPSNPPTCPDCGTGMELRYRRKDGEPFWGCKGYPRCHGTREWGGMKYEEFKWKYEDQYAKAPEEEMFYDFRKMIGEPGTGIVGLLPLRCSKCYAKMDELDDEHGEIYYRCSRYPQCKRELHPEPLDLDPR